MPRSSQTDSYRVTPGSQAAFRASEALSLSAASVPFSPNPMINYGCALEGVMESVFDTLVCEV